MGKCKSLGACLKTPIGALPPDCSPRRKATLKTRSGRGGVGFLLGLLLWGGCGERATNPETSRQPVVFADSALEEAIVRRLEGQSPLPSALAAIEQCSENLVKQVYFIAKIVGCIDRIAAALQDFPDATQHPVCQHQLPAGGKDLLVRCAAFNQAPH